MSEKSENLGGISPDLSCVPPEESMSTRHPCPLSPEEMESIKDIASLKRTSSWVGGIFSLCIVSLVVAVLDTRQEVATRGPRLVALEKGEDSTSAELAIQARINSAQQETIIAMRDQLARMEAKLDRLIERNNGK